MSPPRQQLPPAKKILPLVALLIIILPFTSFFRFNQYLPVPTGETQHKEASPAIQATGIPRRLSFNYKNNILVDKKPPDLYKNLVNTINVYSKAWNPEIGEHYIGDNVTEITSNDGVVSHPYVTIDFLTDTECRDLITQAEPRLLEHFNKETAGEFRSDICRIADLYLKGGYYMDNDMRAMEAVILPDHIIFSTVLEKNEQNFFQSFLASAPGNPILRKTMDVMLGHYEGTHEIKRPGRVYSGMGTATLKDAYDLAIGEDPSLSEKSRFLREINLRDNPSLYKDVERQGIRPMCDIAVHYAETLKVYFYSRAIGTDKC
jgi:hypothetical protein